jgi:hypothetical protein
VSVALRKIIGVESAQVSLNRGLVTIQLKPGNSIAMEQIRKAVASQGFSPRDARVTAIGKLSKRNGKFLFSVTGTQDLYQVMPTPHAPAGNWPREKPVMIRGMIPAGAKGPAAMQILSVREGNQKKK